MSKIKLEAPFRQFRGKICKHSDIIFKQMYGNCKKNYQYSSYCTSYKHKSAATFLIVAATFCSIIIDKLHSPATHEHPSGNRVVFE